MKMLSIAVLLFVNLISASASYAQETEQSGLVKTADGYMVVWNEPGNYFTIEIKGKDVKPDAQHQGWFTVDGKFLQLVSPEKKAILAEMGESGLNDRAMLQSHRDWEADYVGRTIETKLRVTSEWAKLANGKDALFWTFDMPHLNEKQTARAQIYLTTLCGNAVVALNTVLESEPDDKQLRKMLIDTMNTLKMSDKPLSLAKASEMVKARH